jgi:hypothetical protein
VGHHVLSIHVALRHTASLCNTLVVDDATPPTTEGSSVGGGEKGRCERCCMLFPT